jgi:hypothetical protein
VYPSTRRFFVLGVLMLLLLSAVTGLTAANVVPTSKAVDRRSTRTIEELAPAPCQGMGLTSLVTGAGTFNGTSANELMLGSTGIDDVDSRQGDDCILGGAGDDFLKGGAGNDVCLGGPGSDTFHNQCEVQIQ